MIVVTGGAGFIGSNLIRSLNESGESDIIIVDDLGDGEKWKNLRGLKFDRIININSFFPWLNSVAQQHVIKFVYHMGANTNTQERNMDTLLNNNTGFSIALFQACTAYSIPFVYASSAATYGAGEMGFKDDEHTLKRLKPLNPYGYSKHLFDRWVWRQKTKPPFWMGLKFFNVYGPQETHKGEMQSFALKVYSTPEPTIYTDIEGGQFRRDFIYVKDVARAMAKLAPGKITRIKYPKSGIYNMGTGEARTFEDVAKIVLAEMGRDIEPREITLPLNSFEYQAFTQANMDNFRADIDSDFKPLSLEAGIKDYVQNHLLKNHYYESALRSLPTD